MDFYIS